MHIALQSGEDIDLVVQFALHFGITLLQIRLSEAEKRGFAAAANLAGIPLSSWVRERLRLAAIRDPESAGQKIPFVNPIKLGGKS